MSDKCVLKVYVTGLTPKIERPIMNLKKVCEERLNGKYELEVINILEHPEAADEQRILATPTLVKSLPEPVRRVIGDISDIEKVMVGLDLVPED